MKKFMLQILCLSLADCVALLLSYLLGIYLADIMVPQYFHHFSSSHLLAIKLINICLLFFLFIQKELYTKRRPMNIEIKIIFQTILSLIVLDAFAVSISTSSHVSYWTIGIYWIISAILIIVFRYYVIKIMIHYKIWQKPSYIVTDQMNDVNLLLKLLKHHPLLGYEVSSVINITEESELQNLQKKRFFHEIIVFLNTENTIKYMQEIFLLHRKFQSVTIIPEVNSLPLYNIEIDNFFGSDKIMLRMNHQLNKKLNYLVKSIFDYSVVIIILLLVLMITAIFAILIVIENKGGSPFFLQKRVGYKGKIFQIVKLKTMVPNAEILLEKWKNENNPLYQDYVANNFKLDKDPRVTKIGNILRKTSLDEITQVFNILTGDMSLVGPRPLIIGELESYGDAIVYYKTVKPGITGMWQVSGRSNTTFEDRKNLDSWYIKNWSLWCDIIILFKTASVVIKGIGAK